MSEIRASTILPARRTPVDIQTADGLTLVGELAVPWPRTPSAPWSPCTRCPRTAATWTPTSTARQPGDSPRWRTWPCCGSTPGAHGPRGTSGGAFDGGAAEQYDVAAAIEFVEFHDLPRPWLVGWSFGSELVLMHGRDPAIEGAILLSPPLHRATDADLDAWAAFGKPLVVLVPELDDYLRPDEARRRFARVPQAEVIGVDGAKHLWVGESAVRRVLDEIVRVVNPTRPDRRNAPDAVGGLTPHARRARCLHAGLL